MNARSATFTHFGPLFLTALGGWVAFHLANDGALHLLPGLIVAGLLAYGGMLVALRFQTAHDLRATYPTVRPAQRTPLAAPPRPVVLHHIEPRYEMDIAAGD